MTTSGGKWRWIAAGVLVAAGALAAIWAPWSRSTPTPPDGPAGPAAARVAGSAAAPLGAVALALANARPVTAPAERPAPPEEDSDCGATGGSCPEGSLCLDGGCVATSCTPDAGPDARCALAEDRPGVCCRARCTDLDSDAADCGRCGLGCEQGLDCIAGQCKARSCAGRMAGLPCDLGQASGTCCRGTCSDREAWANDGANCGGCGHTCAPGLTCKQGSCVDATTGERPAWTCQDEGHRCPAGTFCVLDACLPRECSADNEGLLCPRPDGQPGHCCGGACTDLFSDKDNCRACGVHCPAGQVCTAGECNPVDGPEATH